MPRAQAPVRSRFGGSTPSQSPARLTRPSGPGLIGRLARAALSTAREATQIAGGVTRAGVRLANRGGR